MTAVSKLRPRGVRDTRKPRRRAAQTECVCVDEVVVGERKRARGGWDPIGWVSTDDTVQSEYSSFFLMNDVKQKKKEERRGRKAKRKRTSASLSPA